MKKTTFLKYSAKADGDCLEGKAIGLHKGDLEFILLAKSEDDIKQICDIYGLTVSDKSEIRTVNIFQNLHVKERFARSYAEEAGLEK